MIELPNRYVTDQWPAVGECSVPQRETYLEACSLCGTRHVGLRLVEGELWVGSELSMVLVSDNNTSNHP